MDRGEVLTKAAARGSLHRPPFGRFPEAVRPNVPLGPMAYFRVGGPVRWLAEPRTDAELEWILREAWALGIETRVLGRGANLLIADEGVDGLVLRLSAFDRAEFDGRGVVLGADCDLPNAVKQAADLGLSGLEPLVGIPGTVGGSTAGNAGGKYGEIERVVEWVRVRRLNGKEERLDREQIRFRYRGSSLQAGGDRTGDDPEGGIVVEVRLRLAASDPEAVRRETARIMDEKRKTQPMSAKSAGCIFRNVETPGGKIPAGRRVD